MKKLIVKYRAMLFQPSKIAILFNPFYLIRRPLFLAAKNFSRQITGGSLLDVGCGSKPYQSLFNVDEYIGIDVELSGHSHTFSQIDKYFDGQNIPFEANNFDAVTMFEVMEHVERLDALIENVHSVLKKDGLLYVSVPFFWPEHEMPYDFRRFTHAGLKSFLESNGFEVLRGEKCNNTVEAIAQASGVSLALFLLPKNRLLRSIGMILICVPLAIVGKFFGFFLSKRKASIYSGSWCIARKV